MLVLMPVAPVQRPAISFLHDYVYGDRKDRQSIVGRAALSGYGDLRKARLPQGDEEVRVWHGFGITWLQGIVLRKHDGQWTAMRLLSAGPNTPKKGWTQKYAAPENGWPAFWKKAEDLGIWTLPDDATLPQKDAKGVLDGFSYVVETLREGRRYRAYAYNNPEYQTQWSQAMKMVALGKLIDAEFPHPAAK